MIGHSLTPSQMPHRKPASLAPRRDALALMADTLATRAAAGEGVTRDDLLIGFSPAEIATHFEAARERARRIGEGRR